MAYALLSDDLLLQLEAAGVSRDARLLYCEGLVYCATALTDGEIRVRLARFSDADDVQACADELVDAGLWHRNGDAYRVDDYLDHQQSSDEVERKRAFARQRADRSRRHRRGDHSRCTDKRYCPHVADSDASRVTHAHATRDVRTPIQSNPKRIGLDKESAGALAPKGANTPAQAAKSPNHDALIEKLAWECNEPTESMRKRESVSERGQVLTEVELMLPGFVVSDAGQLHYWFRCAVTDDVREALESVALMSGVRTQAPELLSLALDGVPVDKAAQAVLNIDGALDDILRGDIDWRAEYGARNTGGAK